MNTEKLKIGDVVHVEKQDIVFFTKEPKDIEASVPDDTMNRAEQVVAVSALESCDVEIVTEAEYDYDYPKRFVWAKAPNRAVPYFKLIGS